MEYSWDEPKRRLNARAHGIDFGDIARFDWNSAILRPTYSDIMGHRRFKAIGRLDDDIVAGIFSSLGREALAIISLRRASRRERRDYEQSQINS